MERQSEKQWTVPAVNRQGTSTRLVRTARRAAAGRDRLADTAGDRQRGEALCRSYDPTWWFPQKPLADYETSMKAIAICGDCPRQEACYEAGKAEEFGIWGGQPRGISFATKTCVGCRTERPLADYAPVGAKFRSKRCAECDPAYTRRMDLHRQRTAAA